MPTRTRQILHAVIPVILVATTLAATSRPAWHARLVKSDPMADSTVAAPRAVRLWFSEQVDAALSSVRLKDASGAAVRTGAPAYDGPAGAGSPLVAPILGTLGPGTYRVSWISASADGHAVKGDFVFHVKAAR